MSAEKEPCGSFLGEELGFVFDLPETFQRFEEDIGVGRFFA